MEMKNISWVGCILCLVAVLPLPYGFYTFLRIAVTITGIIAALGFYKNDDRIWPVFVGIAILFNPLIPIYLTREIWFFIDLAVAGFFGYAALKLKNT